MSIDLPPPKHDHEPLLFPEGFLWGSATSAHQVEGNNTHNDWWAFEQTLEPQMRSGQAANQFELYPQDFALAKKLGQNSHRISLEWSRIEPEEGHFDEQAIEHYRQVLKELKKLDMTVMLTLWHFTLPKWLADQGGWENSKSIKRFIIFIKRVVPEYQEYVDLWVTLNEPGLYTGQAYLNAVFPPHKHSWWSTFRVTANFVKAHNQAYDLIHKLIPESKVGMAQNTVTFRTMQAHSILQHVFVWFYDLAINHLFYILTGLKHHDFLGINYYFHQRISTRKALKTLKKGFLPQTLDVSITKKDASDLGWELYPEGIFDVLADLSEYGKPIYITENGLASTNDDRRCRFLISYLKEIYHSVLAGADVRGYFHWSLIDNFEWEHGYDPRFGLIEVDYASQKRTPRPSSYVYQQIIRYNGIPHPLLRFLGHTIQAEEVLALLKKQEALGMLSPSQPSPNRKS